VIGKVSIVFSFLSVRPLLFIVLSLPLFMVHEAFLSQ
jgi:hypothetical protein